MAKQTIEEIEQDVMLVLDFVERWNKQDKEVAVAQAAQRLEDIHEALLSLRQQIAEELVEALEGDKVSEYKTVLVGLDSDKRQWQIDSKSYNSALSRAQKIIRERLKTK